jgi:hypothetical protein
LRSGHGNFPENRARATGFVAEDPGLLSEDENNENISCYFI